MEEKVKWIFTPYERKIAVVTREIWQKMVKLALDMDIDKGGLYDVRSGVINIWCSRDDHPKDWCFPIRKGALKYPREFLASIYACYLEDGRVELHVGITNYARLDYAQFLLKQKRISYKEYLQLKDLAHRGTEEEWKWVEEKVNYLVAQAEAEKDIKEIIYCPFCGREFLELKFFNNFVDHLATHVKVKAVFLRMDGYYIETEIGTLTPQDYIREKIIKQNK